MLKRAVERIHPQRRQGDGEKKLSSNKEKTENTNKGITTEERSDRGKMLFFLPKQPERDRNCNRR